MHAFIIEDDHLIRDVIADLLGDLGFTRFSYARSEDAAVSGSRGETFDLITADARLLPGDGVRAVETIRKHRTVPVIFVTGYPDDVAKRLEGKFPHTMVVGKPLKRDELAAAVRKLLPKAG